MPVSHCTVSQTQGIHSFIETCKVKVKWGNRLQWRQDVHALQIQLSVVWCQSRGWGTYILSRAISIFLRTSILSYWTRPVYHSDLSNVIASTASLCWCIWCQMVAMLMMILMMILLADCFPGLGKPVLWMVPNRDANFRVWKSSAC